MSYVLQTLHAINENLNTHYYQYYINYNKTLLLVYFRSYQSTSLRQASYTTGQRLQFFMFTFGCRFIMNVSLDMCL